MDKDEIIRTLIEGFDQCKGCAHVVCKYPETKYESAVDNDPSCYDNGVCAKFKTKPDEYIGKDPEEKCPYYKASK